MGGDIFRIRNDQVRPSQEWMKRQATRAKRIRLGVIRRRWLIRQQSPPFETEAIGRSPATQVAEAIENLGSSANNMAPGRAASERGPRLLHRVCTRADFLGQLLQEIRVASAAAAESALGRAVALAEGF